MWTLKSKLESDDGAQYVELRASPDEKLFRYYAYAWMAVGDDELLYHPDGGYWSHTEMSGYYDSLAECEAAARSSLNWLGPTSGEVGIVG
jgi:hypothetical protein